VIYLGLSEDYISIFFYKKIDTKKQKVLGFHLSQKFCLNINPLPPPPEKSLNVPGNLGENEINTNSDDYIKIEILVFKIKRTSLPKLETRTYEKTA